MLWLLDSDRANLAYLVEHDAIITTRRMAEHSEWASKLPVSAYGDASGAAYAVIEGDTELYRVETYELVTQDGESWVEVSGRSATSLLHERTVVRTLAWTASKPGAIVAALIASLTGDRAIAGLTFGTGSTLGTNMALQQSWGDMGETCIDILAGQSLGWKATLDASGNIVIDVVAPSTNAVLIGEEYGNASGAARNVDRKPWRNYAVVLGEGEGSARVRVDVDQTGADPLRELYVNASDLTSARTLNIAVSIWSGGSDADRVVPVTPHGLSNGNRVKFSGLASAPLVNNTYYYIVGVLSDRFYLSLTEGGAVINITEDGTGTITSVLLTTAQYAAVLTQRGTEKLAEANRVEYAEATTSEDLDPGDLVYYDAGLWAQEMHVSEVETVYEGGMVRCDIALGEVPATLERAVRRAG